MKVGIVGHGADKFTSKTRHLAKMAIVNIIRKHEPCTIISGESPVGGIDVWAHEIAVILKVPFKAYEPKQLKWDAEYGFKQRNIDIALNSDIVYNIVVRDYPPGFTGDKYPDYHCIKRKHTKPDGSEIDTHAKSGGCWTAWYAIEHEGKAEWVII